MEKKPLKNSSPCMIVSPQRVLRRKLIVEALFSTFFMVSSATKAPPYQRIQNPFYSKSPSFSARRRKVSLYLNQGNSHSFTGFIA
jgi:hypothetical protein